MKKVTFTLLIYCMAWGILYSSASACSSFILSNPSLLILGANQDNNGELPGMVIVNQRGISKRGWEKSDTDEIAHWTSNYGSITFSFFGREYPYYGMNEAGLTVATSALPETQAIPSDERPPLDGPFWLQYLLDKCSSIDEVIETEKQVRLKNDSDHYMICDSSGQCAIIECLNGVFTVYRNDQVKEKILTNAPYMELLKNSNNILDPAKDPYRSYERFRRGSAARYPRFSLHEKNGIEWSFFILKEMEQKPSAAWSMVFDIKKQEIYFKTNTFPMIRKIRLNQFDYSCSSPKRILRINKDVKGDVYSQFALASHRVAVLQFYHSCKLFGIQKSMQEVDEHIRFLESFYCTD